ncbi:hypothetical protein Clacol_008235 [Clathrus columnatus]|uniref:Uncharacterized protein n=1 Tax=Clathrus columnatus TaxID=1419009 RepID=A0AAV5AMR2_9AGAM|nr:hypothetical protein Clacol_008235 [Clathrus columnatus]
MQVVFDDDCLLHNPPYETLSGFRVPYYESPARYRAIRSALERSTAEKETSLFSFLETDHGIDLDSHILNVHSSDYVEYLKNAYTEWDGVIPDTFLHQRLSTFKDMPTLRPIAKAGEFPSPPQLPSDYPNHPGPPHSLRLLLFRFEHPYHCCGGTIVITFPFSLGVDTFKDDPISDFKLTLDGYYRIGEAISTVLKPTLFVMEGTRAYFRGYDLPTIGENVRAVLEGFLVGKGSKFLVFWLQSLLTHPD